MSDENEYTIIGTAWHFNGSFVLPRGWPGWGGAGEIDRAGND